MLIYEDIRSLFWSCILVDFSKLFHFCISFASGLLLSGLLKTYLFHFCTKLTRGFCNYEKGFGSIICCSIVSRFCDKLFKFFVVGIIFVVVVLVKFISLFRKLRLKFLSF